MANKVKELVQDVAYRLNEPQMNGAFTFAAILRAMNRVYQDLNHECKCLEKTKVISAGDLSETVYEIDKPVDWIAPFRIEDSDGNKADIDYFEPEQFEQTDYSNTAFTILGDSIRFANVTDESAFTIYYRSAGLILVSKDDADLAAGEVNTPEWPSYLHDALIYETCLNMKNDYPMFQADLYNIDSKKRQLRELNYKKQDVTPPILGGAVLPSTDLSDYE